MKSSTQAIVATFLVFICLVYFNLYDMARRARPHKSIARRGPTNKTTANRTAVGEDDVTSTRRVPKFARWKKGNVNACILVLARHRDLKLLKETIIELEARFNHKYNYPYVILLSEMAIVPKWKWYLRYCTQSTIDFGLVDQEHWSTPEWIDTSRLSNLTANQSAKNIMKSNRLSYHHMCRFYSGFFFRHELTLKYDYYLRLDSHVDFPCPFPSEDPFQTLVRRNKLYGFTIACNEMIDFLPNLWDTIKRWLHETGRMRTRANRRVEQVNNFFSTDERLASKERGSCGLDRFQFWTNFEIASFAIFRNETYLSFFDYLDKAGGFYYERWGDAPVHTFYILAMIELSRVHRFDDIGYGHNACYSPPANDTIRKMCDNRTSYRSCSFCHSKWDAMTHNII